MDILNLNIDIPRHVCVSKNATETLVDTVLNQQHEHIVLVYTGGNTETYADQINDQLGSRFDDSKNHVYKFLLKNSSIDEMERLANFCGDLADSPLVIGIGGGSCIDVVKLVAHRRNLSLFIYPTVLSCDCLASPISVLMDGNKKVRMQGSVPNGVFIDVRATAKAPKSLILSGIADLMSNASALLDINFCPEEEEEHGFAILLSKSSVNYITSMKDVAIDRPRFQAALAQGLILSGLSMNLAGSSITASGAEHLVSHAIDFYGYGSCSHGTQVYIGMLACDLLRKHFDTPTIGKRYLRAMKTFGLQQHIDTYCLTPNELVKAIMKAPSLRPERTTILHRIEGMSENDILKIIKPLFKKIN